ncbi:MAG: M20/M25/M40 family metallo-hydrolase [Bacteroides sp.]|nr:M20/M25/M40 family metallo-hydrolase [Bacteroides sp.]
MQTIAEESIALLRGMIAIPSPSFHEEEVSLHISSFLEKCGIAHRRIANNIIALNRSWSPDKKTLMLCAHIDTVEPCSGYDFDPFLPDMDEAARAIQGYTDGLIPGLGANDDGASAVSMIAAFRHFYGQELPFNLLLVLSAEEERSGTDGMRLVWESLEKGISAPPDDAHDFPVPDYAIVGEPTGMKAAVAERGLLVIDGCAEGVSGHAAHGEGVNAMYIAIEDIQKLRGFRFSRHSPLMGDVRLSVTQINAGTAHNVIPDRCTFVVDIRPTEQYCNREILDMLQAGCTSTLKARNLNNRSSATPAGSPLLKCAEATGIGTFVSPTTSDWMRIGCDAVKMGPGDSARSHRKNEFVTEYEIREGIRTYIKFIQHFQNLFKFIANKI